MRVRIGVVVLCTVITMAAVVPPLIVRSWGQAAKSDSSPPPGQVAAPGSQAGGAPMAQSLWDSVKASPRPVVLGAVIAGLAIIGACVLLYRAVRAGPNPLILRLTPSFFFWLSMTYTALLLLVAAVYILCRPESSPPKLLAGMLPVAVPWFGALGAVTISLEGVFLHNNQWDSKYNYWHIGRPLFGGVLGIVAFFLFVVIGATAGTAPKFLQGGKEALEVPFKDFIIYYVLAFLVGYREETFRELIKRATDLILKPGTPAAATPAVSFRVAGAAQQQIQCPAISAAQAAQNPSHITVEVQNAGSAPLIGPSVTIAPVPPTPATVFAVANDHVTGGPDLAPGQTRQVDITFTPPAAGNADDFVGTLTVTATNLTAPKTIRATGHRNP